MLLHGFEPECVDEHVKQASCQDRKQGRREFASLFDACGRLHLRVAALRMKAVLGGMVEAVYKRHQAGLD